MESVLTIDKESVAFTIRNFDFDKDYAIISQWWREHGSYAPKREYLPQNGIIVEINSAPVCAGFLYSSDSRICMFEWVVVDPSAQKDVRDISLNLLIEAVVDAAKALGFGLIYSSIGIPKYIDRLKNQGFVEADKHQTHMFKEML